MSSDFECFVFFNGEKYTIIVNKSNLNINNITFGDVFGEILKIKSKQNISIETHIFEIYDIDRNEYKKIESFQQLIKYLSRIRVLPKTQIIDNKTDNKLIVLRDDYQNSTQTHNNNDYKHNVLNKSQTLVNPFTHSSNSYSKRQPKSSSLAMTSFQTQPLYNTLTNDKNSSKTHNYNNYMNSGLNKSETLVNPLSHSSNAYSERHSMSASFSMSSSQTQPLYSKSINYINNETNSESNASDDKVAEEVNDGLRPLLRDGFVSTLDSNEGKCFCKYCEQYFAEIESFVNHIKYENHLQNKKRVIKEMQKISKEKKRQKRIAHKIKGGTEKTLFFGQFQKDLDSKRWEEIRNEGIVKIQKKKFYCGSCDKNLKSLTSSLHHCRSEGHLMKKTNANTSSLSTQYSPQRQTISESNHFTSHTISSYSPKVFDYSHNK